MRPAVARHRLLPPPLRRRRRRGRAGRAQRGTGRRARAKRRRARVVDAAARALRDPAVRAQPCDDSVRRRAGARVPRNGRNRSRTRPARRSSATAIPGGAGCGAPTSIPSRSPRFPSSRASPPQERSRAAGRAGVREVARRRADRRAMVGLTRLLRRARGRRRRADRRRARARARRRRLLRRAGGARPGSGLRVPATRVGRRDDGGCGCSSSRTAR